MIAIIERINEIGVAFVDFALPMLIQSGALILILLLVDLLLRKRVRAVFRYWIWMLVLVKLVLPTSLSSPVSVGRWFGDELMYLDVNPEPAPQPQDDVLPAPASALVSETPQIVDVPRVEIETHSPEAVSAEPTIQKAKPAITKPTKQPAPAMPSLSWHGVAFLTWLVVLIVMVLLLLQRALFVRRLVAQASAANNSMAETLANCRERMAVKGKVGLKVSGGATSPAVCGLLRPVILVPENLTPSLSSSELRVVLLHELAHIKRYDLWLNFAQTLLQIFYFYNPLLWLANAMIRRTREQAVDEMVLVAMEEKARQYPQTLVNVAKLAFKRPALSLRLIGVVESRSALTGRIKHILSRPFPKTAKLSLLGLLAIIIAAVILLPMAKSDRFDWFGARPLVKFSSDDKPTGNRVKTGNTITYSRHYTVEFRKDEELAIVAELYQVGKPMRHLGCKIFSGSEQPQEMSVMLSRSFANKNRTTVEHDLKITLGNQTFRLNDVLVKTSEFFNNMGCGFFPGSEIVEPERKGKPYAEFQNLLRVRSSRPGDGKPRSPRIWMPTYNNVTWTVRDGYFISVNMFAMSQLDNFHVDVPHYAEKMQLPDGTYISGDSTKEQRKAVADEYILSIKRALMREQMPLPELSAHEYYEVGEPVYIYVDARGSGQWRPTLDEIDRDADTNPVFFLIDGKEYASRVGFGPFGGGGHTLHLPGELYVGADDFHLPPGKHTVAYGWKNLDVINPDDPDRVVHYDKLTTDVVEFEVVEELPVDYYAEVYEEGWEEILRNSIETPLTDDMRKYHVSGPLLALQVESLPFDIAFEIYAQAEGVGERFYAGRIAREANSGRHIMGCDRQVDELNWETVGEKRWRLILVPSRKVAMLRPPIHRYYGREFVTEWVTFEKSGRFESNRRRAYNHNHAEDGPWISKTRVMIGKSRKSSPRTNAEMSGRVVDRDGKPVAGVQVALSTDKLGVQMSRGRLEAMPGDVDSRIAETDSQGEFDLGQRPEGDFDLIVVHDKGFALAESEDFFDSSEIRLQPWGRIEGRIANDHVGGGSKVLLSMLPHFTWSLHKRHYRYETECDAEGRFAFEKVPARWFEAGYMIRKGDNSWSFTSRTPVKVESGRTARITLGGSGRPVIGKFVPPAGYDKPIYFGSGIRSLQTARPKEPRPDNYDRMSKREQRKWREQWRKTAQYRQYNEAYWHDPNWRHYTFRINKDGSFRIDDVIAGKYELTVYLEPKLTSLDQMRHSGGYSGKIEVPEMLGGQSAEPLDLGEFEIKINKPLHLDDAPPLSKAKVSESKNRPDAIKASRITESAERLRRIGVALHSYAKDHSGKDPDMNSWHELRKYFRNKGLPWPIQAGYLGGGRTTADRPNIAMHHDIQLTPYGKETNVLFNDGHVEFVGPERLNELNINGTSILIDTRILTATDDFLKSIELDANSVRASDAWSEHLLTDPPADPNSVPYLLILDDLNARLLLKAMATSEGKGCKSIAAPQVMALDGRPAMMKVISDEYYFLSPSDGNDSSNPAESKPRRVEVGTSIRIAPDVLPDTNDVRLDFEWELCQVRGYGQRVRSGKRKRKSPLFAVDNLKTTAVVPDGMTLLICGKKYTEYRRAEWSVPVLGRVPVIGGAFNGVNISEGQQKTLLILVKPTTNPQTHTAPTPPPLDPDDPLLERLQNKFKDSAAIREMMPTFSLYQNAASNVSYR